MTKTKQHQERDRRRLQREGLMAAWRGVEVGDPIGHGNPAVYVWLRQHDAFLRTVLGKSVFGCIVWHVERDNLHDPAKRYDAHNDVEQWVGFWDQDEVTAWYLRRALTDPSLGVLDPDKARPALVRFMRDRLDELCRIVDGPSFAETLQRNA